jgi:hypothetical protein
MKYLIPFNKHPRRNLPKHSSNKRTESNFVLAFGRSYYQELSNHSAKQYQSFEIARELYIPSLGIADIVSVFTTSRNKTLHAFEMKIRDWQKALAQAYRYKYYANSVFVVIPPCEAMKAKQSLPVFQSTNIGLWAFDAGSGIIKKIYNPKRDKPLSDTAHTKALTLLGHQVTSPLVS